MCEELTDLGSKRLHELIASDLRNFSTGIDRGASFDDLKTILRHLRQVKNELEGRSVHEPTIPDVVQ